MLPTSLVMDTKRLKTVLDDYFFYIEYKQRCANKSLTEWTIFDVGEGRKESKVINCFCLLYSSPSQRDSG